MTLVTPSASRVDRSCVLSYLQCGTSSAWPTGPKTHPREFSRVGACDLHGSCVTPRGSCACTVATAQAARRTHARIERGRIKEAEGSSFMIFQCVLSEMRHRSEAISITCDMGRTWRIPCLGQAGLSDGWPGSPRGRTNRCPRTGWPCTWGRGTACSSTQGKRTRRCCTPGWFRPTVRRCSRRLHQHAQHTRRIVTKINNKVVRSLAHTTRRRGVEVEMAP